jgi:hypothetical protein
VNNKFLYHTLVGTLMRRGSVVVCVVQLPHYCVVLFPPRSMMPRYEMPRQLLLHHGDANHHRGVVVAQRLQSLACTIAATTTITHTHRSSSTAGCRFCETSGGGDVVRDVRILCTGPASDTVSDLAASSSFTASSESFVSASCDARVATASAAPAHSDDRHSRSSDRSRSRSRSYSVPADAERCSPSER